MRAQLFENKYRGRLWNVTTHAEILDVLRDFKQDSKNAPGEDPTNSSGMT